MSLKRVFKIDEVAEPSYAMARQAVVIIRQGAEAVRSSGRAMADVDQTEDWLIGLVSRSGAPMYEGLAPGEMPWSGQMHERDLDSLHGALTLIKQIFHNKREYDPTVARFGPAAIQAVQTLLDAMRDEWDSRGRRGP